MRPLEIGNSTEEERRQYIKNTFRCIADCDMCGLCTVLHGKDPEVAYVDYISGKRDYLMYRKITDELGNGDLWQKDIFIS